MLEGMKQLFEVKSYHLKVTSDELTVENDFIYGMVGIHKIPPAAS